MAADALGDELYSLTLVAGRGRNAVFAYRGDFETSEPLPQPPPGSLEAELLTAGHPAAFLDLRSAPETTFRMSGMQPGHWLELDWRQVFDGVLYLREMRPLTSLPKREQASRRSEGTR